APPRRVLITPAELELGAYLGQMADDAGQSEPRMVRPLVEDAAAEEAIARHRVARGRLAALRDLVRVAHRLAAAERDVHSPVQLLDERQPEHADRQRRLIRDRLAGVMHEAGRREVA